MKRNSGISDVKTVLFVCVHNSGRSQMAEAFFNQLAEGRARAISAGTDPADAVEATVVAAMRELGMDISGNRPKALSLAMTEQVHKVITMGCEAEGVCPATFVETEDWELEDPKGKPLGKVREIRDQIRSRVADLVRDLKAEGAAGTEPQ